MRLGEMWISENEIESVSWRNGCLVMVLDWSLRELPALLPAETHLLLRWHDDDPLAGLAMRLESWVYDASREDVRIELLELQKETESPSGEHEQQTTRGLLELLE